MGRPSLAPERRAQILDAFEEAVGLHGLEGASLETIGRAAGLNRQLVLHYFGSREALVDAAVERVVTAYRERIAVRLGSLADAERLADLLAWIFLGDFCEPRVDALLRELARCAARRPGIRRALEPAYRELGAVLGDELAKAVPEASAEAIRATSFGVLALCFGTGELTGLGFPKARRRDAHDAAWNLVRALRA